MTGGRPVACRPCRKPAATWPGPQFVSDLRRAGWRPTPFREFVLKVHGRCNLACDYCYVYTKADQSWRSRPATMSASVWQAVARRIGEHSRVHRLDAIRVILHGGEPLLAGVGRLARIADAVRAALPRHTSADVVVQTNAVLLRRTALDVLLAHRVAVGVSVDGPAADHDRHRRYANGRGSHAAVARALALLGRAEYRSAFAGILCTVDLQTDPVACYEELVGFGPPAIDFIVPHANWSAPPPRGGSPTATPYADWLIRAFDRWYHAPRQETRLRLFEEIINLILGGRSRTEQVGLSPVAVVVVETDGDIQQVDTLKSSAAGITSTGFNVLADRFDTALSHPGIAARQAGPAALCETCRDCPVHRICGGGNYAHRFRGGVGFRNPSVYCADLYHLIDHIGDTVARDLARGPANRR